MNWSKDWGAIPPRDARGFGTIPPFDIFSEPRRCREMRVMKLEKRHWAASAVISVALLTSVGIWLLNDVGYDETDVGGRPDERSSDLAADLHLMWQTADRAS